MSGVGRHIFLIAGEHSGDQLGYRLMRSLRAAEPGIRLSGIGGEAMAGEGLTSLFPLADIAVMGFLPVIKRLPTLLKRIRMAADAVVAAQPDALVIIDSPDFTHRVARKVRRRLPNLPVIDYVCPSVWAWRSGRASKMRAYIDHVLAILPFEPAALQRLNGPPGTYVGHPLIERLDVLQPDPDDAARRLAEPPLLIVLPGSRRSEIHRLMPVFRDTLALVRRRHGDLDVILPTVADRQAEIEAALQDWPVKPRVVPEEAAKYAAFRQARAALAKSGTVTLELALAGVPSVVGYQVSKLEEAIARRMIEVPTILLPNLILGNNVYPEFIQADCAPGPLAEALFPLLTQSPAREAQVSGLKKLAHLMQLPGGESPSAAAARVVLQVMDKAR
ncbi:lipid-A-disaccharide synthase [Methylovirgula sp. 4M-Z18]|uniref:lipid-A-disaccharide synthase n=1 Tax=Methylovirgula sp. 4M-Z18 TaxID=2293567 RepID=UPI000E2EF68E|nr:lipid-A-disaccharide synthase [Methylovirgula sp. 4M-Z18]RFB80224.1 lipid-A-disaccharide synthase [Methylovirgula sp. 4M-Z18]